MISNSVIAVMIITVILASLSILIPFGLVFFNARKKETGSIGSFGLGALAYFWSQYLLPFPILYILMNFTGFMNIYNNEKYYVIYILITSAMLGMLGTLGRLWCVWLMNRNIPSLYRALSSGIGYSVFGSLSVVTAYVTYVRYAGVLNSQGSDAFSDMLKAGNAGVTNEAIENIINQLTGASVVEIAFEGINAVLVVIVEMALIAFIYEGYIRGKKWTATLICAGINILFSFFTILFSSMSTEKMGNVVSGLTGSIVYNSFMLVCGLVAAWFLYGCIIRYRTALKEGPYAHYAYFEVKDDKSKEGE